MNSPTVRCRFAPSPTGYLHVGGARTALFNYLLARQTGGVFIVRIEDTDQTRNVPGAEDHLLEDLRWLGLNWDEGPGVGGKFGPYRQSEKLQHYRDRVQHLLDTGNAYYAFDTREELDAMRKAAEAKKQNFIYPRPKTFPSQRDADAARAAGRPVVVRFKMPDHDFTVRDTLLGEVTQKAHEVQDFVILKADGFPTYHFAVVVDDADMQITHVLRGQEHLLNTVNHIALQEAFGYPVPVYAHLPVILNPNGAKLSKRDKDKAVREAVGNALKNKKCDENTLVQIADIPEWDTFAAWRKGDLQLPSDALQRLATFLNVPVPEVMIHDFRVSGYLPEVLNNYLALLGWSPGDGREKFTMDELCQAFRLERIGKTNAKFDRDKLLNFNTTALAAATPARRLSALRDYAAVAGSPLEELADPVLTELLAICDGLRTMRDMDTKCAALFVPDEAIAYDAGALKKFVLKDNIGLNALKALRPRLADLADWSAEAVGGVVRGYAEQETQIGLGKVAQPLRVALTGGAISPPIIETLAIVGRDLTLRRIDRLLKHCEMLPAE
jgi:glutamyl/glutaminyl-tRNA synthetase